jgi:hypothetical protein
MRGKMAFIFFGIIFAWIALFIMLQSLYQNIINTTASAISGGTYYTAFYESQNAGYFAGIIICVIISIACLMIGLGGNFEKKDGKQLPPLPTHAMTNPQQASSTKMSGMSETCPVCNKTISSDNNFCPYCAADLRGRSAQPPTSPF